MGRVRSGSSLVGAAALLAALTSTPAPARASDRPAAAALDDVGQRLIVRDIQLARNVRPERPTAGQRAQVDFGLRIDGPPPTTKQAEERLIEALHRRLQLVVSGKGTARVEEGLEYTTRLRRADMLLAEGTITFNWPRLRNDSPLPDRASTITQTLQLRSPQDRAQSDPILVEVNVPTRDWTMIIALAALALLASATAGGYYYLIRSRRQAPRGPREDRSSTPVDRPPDEPRRPVADPHLGQAPPARSLQPVPAVPEALAQAIAEGNAVLVLGSGAAAQAGLPTADRLLLAMIEELEPKLPDGLTYVLRHERPDEELVRLLTKLGGVPKVMDAIVSAVPRDELASVIGGILSAHRPSPAMFNMLADLPWRGLISLTWDDFAARIFAVRRPGNVSAMRKFTRTEASDVLPAMRAGERLLLQALGDLQRPHSLSLSIEDFRRNMVRAPDFQKAMGSLLQTHSFLFLGVGTDTLEPFLQTIASDVEVAELTHFALLPDDPTNDVWAPTLARFGVRILTYQPDAGHSGLALFSAALARETKARVSARPAARRTASTLSSQAVSQVRLTNIGPFESLSLDFARPDEGAEASTHPWSVIFGGNGVGKSSILRAIALSLAGEDPGVRRSAARLLKAGAPEGLIEVQIGTTLVRTRLVRSGGRVDVQTSGHTPVQNGSALVLGFPALRGARTPDPGGPSPTGEARGPEPPDLLPLVNGEVDGRLADMKQWLLNVLVQAADGQSRAIALRDLLDGIIADIIPGRAQSLAPIDTSDFIIRVRTPEGSIPFDDLSQGMTSIFNWIGILTQRLFEICERSPAPNLEPATVLVDEVDAHLHPEWQRRLVELTRTHFPNVHVIATSHSPLLAGALHSNEVIVLRRNPQTGAVELYDRPVETFGMTSQRILTSAVFELPTERNTHVQQLVNEYAAIFQKASRTPEEEERLAAMESQLEHYEYGAAVRFFTAPPEPSEEQLDALRRRFGTPDAPLPAQSKEPAR